MREMREGRTWGKIRQIKEENEYAREMRARKMDHGSGPEEGFPRARVPQQEELSTQGEMPVREADSSLLGFSHRRSIR